SNLVGTWTSNPARHVSPYQVPNPATDVLREFGVDRSQDFCQYISQDAVDKMTRRMRESIIGQKMFSNEEILDALTTPDRSITAWTAALPALRAQLDPLLCKAATDDDLLRAARNSSEKLFLSGSCRVQVLWRKRSSQQSDLLFTPEDLGRRLTVDLTVRP